MDHIAAPKEYKIRFVRHGLALSNAADNSGVHLLDPVLTTLEQEEQWVKEGKLKRLKLKTGRYFVENTLRLEFSNYKTQSSVFVISPLARAIQTFVISVSEATLRKARIVLEPIIMEQTRWFSDRPRPLAGTRALISEELKKRDFKDPVRIEDLDIDWSRMKGDRDESGNFFELPEQKAQTASWRLKQGFWHPQNLIKRGRRAVWEILEECRRAELGANGRDFAVSVFGHGGFVNYMAQEVGDIQPKVSPPVLSVWATGERRDYRIIDRRSPSSDELMIETKESREKRWPKVVGTPSVNAKDEATMRAILQQHICTMEYWDGLGNGKMIYDEADQVERNASIKASG